MRVVLLLAMIFFLKAPVSAEAGVGEKLAGVAIKSTVKIYTAVTNIEKTKKKILDKLQKTDEAEFRERYAKLYELVKDLPSDIKAAYRITPDMTMEQMAENVRSVDKKAVYKIINSMSDRTVTELFKQYLKEARKKSKKSEANKVIVIKKEKR